MKKIVCSIVLFLLLSITGFSQDIPTDSLYLGQTPPGDTPVIFASGKISLSNRMESKIVFSPNGKECYFSTYKLQNNTWNYINYYARYINDAWTEFEQLSFEGNQNLEIAGLSADGKKFYFNLSDINGGDILMSERSDSGWSNPQALPAPINSNYTDVWYSETVDSVKYISSDRPGNICDFWRVYQLPDQSFKAENLGFSINASGWHYDPCIAPDESYLIYVKADGTAAKLYICFNKGNGTWTEPIDMNKSGAGINDENQDRPILSPDGKYLFFNRHSGYPYTNKADIFWVNTSIIEKLKKIAFPTATNEARQSQLLIYPNPAKNNLYIALNNSDLSNNYFEITSILGVTILNGNLKSNSIDISKLKTGTYFLQIKLNTGIIIKQFIVE